jgi:hypothetical protein
MRASADAEEATEKHLVTPGSIKPARELLGELLIDLGQPAQALTEFEASHRVDPIASRASTARGARRSWPETPPRRAPTTDGS